jgi:hypothetical protein
MDGLGNTTLPSAANLSNTLTDLFQWSSLYLHISRLLKDCLDIAGTTPLHTRHEARLGSV